MSERTLIPKRTHEAIVDALIRTRTNRSHAAGETTLLCYGAMDLCSGNRAHRKSGTRIIESVLKRNGIGDKRRTGFTKRIATSPKPEVAKYLLSLQPYRETKEWLRTETK